MSPEKDALDLLLVKPGEQGETYGDLRFTLAAVEPPLWAALLAAFLRERGFRVGILDGEAENLSLDGIVARVREASPLLVEVVAAGSNPSASSTPKMVAARKILSALRERTTGIRTLLSGIHPSALPEQTLEEEAVDFVVRGEGFYAVEELLRFLRHHPQGGDVPVIPGLWYRSGGKLVGHGWSDLVRNLDPLPLAAWDLLPMDKYRAHNWHCFDRIERRSPYAVLYTSLGCPYHCRFCNISALYNGRAGIRYRGLASIVDEIGYLVERYGVRNLKIVDELFVLQRDRVRQWCDLLIARGYDLNIWAYARVDTVDPELLRKLKQAGVHWLAYGIESGSKRVRDSVIKGGFGQERIREAVAMTHDAGISIVANFIFGLPEDDAETLRETLEMAKELNCAYANFYAAMAYPGSALYQDALSQGWPLPGNWGGYSQYSYDTLPLPTRHLSGPEVLAFRDRAFLEYYDRPAYLAMMERRFGPEIVGHLREMMRHRLPRRHLLAK